MLTDAIQRLYKWRLENCPNTEGNFLSNTCDVCTFRSNAQLLLHLKECVKYRLKPALEHMGRMRNQRRNWIGKQEGKTPVGVFRDFWKSCFKINIQEGGVRVLTGFISLVIWTSEEILWTRLNFWIPYKTGDL